MSKKLIIKNVGPIKNIDLNIKKVNVFMGPQSSGKSTVAKILSFCSWVEKDISFHQSFDKYINEDSLFLDRLEVFHKMKGYFDDNSEIQYFGNAVSINFKNKKVSIKWLKTRFDYKRCKISYIPAERGIVILPEMEKVELPNNYLKSFLYDWFDTRKNHTIDNKFPILDLNVNYYYSEDNKSHISSDNYDILLSQTSSGIQSITPLLTMINNLMVEIYNKDLDTSYELDEVKIRVTNLIIDELILKPLFGTNFSEEERSEQIKAVNSRIQENDESVIDAFKKFKSVRKNLFETHRTNIILEEPEQNLFPSTQKQLIYTLLNYLNNNLDHNLTLTTHSPYILYAINNCILSFLVKNKFPTSLSERNKCQNASMNPNDISIYEIKDGNLYCIQQDNGLIGENFFDDQMRQVMDDFYLLLNYLE